MPVLPAVEVSPEPAPQNLFRSGFAPRTPASEGKMPKDLGSFDLQRWTRIRAMNRETAVEQPRNPRNPRKDRTKGCRGGSADFPLPGERLPERSGQLFVSLRGFRGGNCFFQVYGHLHY